MDEMKKSFYENMVKKPEISFWLGIIIPVVGIAVSWGILNTKVTNLEERFNYFGGRFQDRTDAVDMRLREQDAIFIDIQVRLAEIQKDIVFIKDSLVQHTER